MAGGDPKPIALQDNEDEDIFYDAYSEEYLMSLMSNPNPNLMDLPFSKNTLLAPPPAPALEINRTALLGDPSVSNPHGDTIKEYLKSLRIDDGSLTVNTSDALSDDINEYIDYTDLGEIGNENVGESGILQANAHVFAENTMNFETGGASAMPVPVITPTPTISQGLFLCTYCNLLRQLVHANGIYISLSLTFYCYTDLYLSGCTCYLVTQVRR